MSSPRDFVSAVDFAERRYRRGNDAAACVRVSAIARHDAHAAAFEAFTDEFVEELLEPLFIASRHDEVRALGEHTPGDVAADAAAGTGQYDAAILQAVPRCLAVSHRKLPADPVSVRVGAASAT